MVVAPLDPHQPAPSFREMSERFLESAHGEGNEIDDLKRDLRDHVLPRFGELRLDEVDKSDICTWLAEKVEVERRPGTDSRLYSLISRLWTLAVELKLPGACPNPLEGSLRFDRRGQGGAELTGAEAHALLEAAGASPNRQLKYILSLLMLTGARQRELLNAKWEHIDLAEGVWRLELPASETARELRLSAPAVTLLSALPRWEGCSYLIANPTTSRPYRSVRKDGT